MKLWSFSPALAAMKMRVMCRGLCEAATALSGILSDSAQGLGRNYEKSFSDHPYIQPLCYRCIVATVKPSHPKRRRVRCDRPEPPDGSGISRAGHDGGRWQLGLSDRARVEQGFRQAREIGGSDGSVRLDGFSALCLRA